MRLYYITDILLYKYTMYSRQMLSDAKRLSVIGRALQLCNYKRQHGQ